MPQNETKPAVSPCKTDLRLLSGCYGWIGQGTDSKNVKTRAVGYFNFSSVGQVSGMYEGSFGGTQTFRTFIGTVVINDNGFGKMHFTDSAGFKQNFDFVMLADSKELYLINRVEQALQTLTAKKV